MAPYPASVSQSLGTVVVPRSAAPSSVPFLPVSSGFDKRSTASELSTHLPYLNNTVPRAVRSLQEPNITARSDFNLTARSDYNLTTRSEFNLTARSQHDVAVDSRYNLTARSYPNVTVRSEHNLTARSYPNITTRSSHNLTARSEYNLTAYANYNITTRSDLNLTARSDSNFTSQLYQNITARSDYNLTTRSDLHLTARSDSNLTARADFNLTTRAAHNLTARSGANLTSRSDDLYNSTDLSEPKMIIRNANYNLSTAQDGLSPRDVQSAHHLFGRATSTHVPCDGCTDPTKINNNAFFALFAILGAVMVVGGIWFFFHAKNGGFVWQENDWDDYKSTVLRRKGPDGKTLSNATKSTRLGGGSIIARHDRLAAMTVVGYDEKGRKGIKAKRGFGGTHSVYYDDDFSNYTGSRADEMSEVRTINDYHVPRQHRGGANSNESHGTGRHHSRRYQDRDVREYKHEKPARVGGMNRVADGSNYTYSEDSATVISESTNRSTANLIKDSHREADTPRSEEKKRVRAEKKAHEEASRMERKWRKDAEAAARAIARENAPSPIPPQHAHRARRDSRSSSPKKRDYSFSKGADEVLSTAYTASSSGDRSHSASYYDAYRPKNESVRNSSKPRGGSPTKAGYRRYAESEAETSDSGTRTYKHDIGNRSAAKEKKAGRGGRDVMAGYRRGMDEDDF